MLDDENSTEARRFSLPQNQYLFSQIIEMNGPTMNSPNFQRLIFSSRKQRFFVTVGLVCWGLTLMAGIICLTNYSSSPSFPIKTNVPATSDSLGHPLTRVTGRKGLGSGADAGTHLSAGEVAKSSLAKVWPTTAGITPFRDRPTLVICLHPRCPCSRASLRQLERVLASDLVQSNPKTQCSVVALFYCPENESSTWTHTQLWSMAAKIPNSTLVVDRDAQAATKFGATTSGHVLLYADGGQLLFSGSITSGRGHEGDNYASQTLTRILSSQPVEQREFAVFGCAITATALSLTLANP